MAILESVTTIKINIDSIDGDLGYIEFLRERHPDADIECGDMESVWSVCGGDNDEYNAADSWRVYCEII